MNSKLINYDGSKLFELLMENDSPIGIALLTPDLEIARANKTLCRLIGRKEKNVIGKYCYDLIGANRNKSNLKKSEKICDCCVALQTIKNNKKAESIQEISHGLVARIIAYPLRDTKGKIIGVLKLIENIADKINDPMTGIKNYRFFEESLTHECYRTHRLNVTSSVVILDLDNFKNVNDIYGHNYGDKVLKKVANTINTSLRKTDKLCRIGGDEFGIIFPDTAKEKCETTVRRLKRLIEKNFKNYKLSFCYGIASIPENGNNSMLIREAADKELYEQKDARRTNNILVS